MTWFGNYFLPLFLNIETVGNQRSGNSFLVFSLIAFIVQPCILLANEENDKTSGIKTSWIHLNKNKIVSQHPVFVKAIRFLTSYNQCWGYYFYVIKYYNLILIFFIFFRRFFHFYWILQFVSIQIFHNQSFYTFIFTPTNGEAYGQQRIFLKKIKSYQDIS